MRKHTHETYKSKQRIFENMKTNKMSKNQSKYTYIYPIIHKISSKVKVSKHVQKQNVHMKYDQNF